MKKATLLKSIPFTIDHERVMREMKIPRARELSDIKEKPLADSIKKAIDRAYALIEGKGVYKTFKLSGVKGNVMTGDETGDIFTGDNIVKLLEGSDYATLMGVTIGSKLEYEVETLQGAGEITEAFALEMVGGWMADYMADRVDENIEREIKRKGYARTMRYSPGYGDWSLEKQPDILRLCEGEKIGISLTDTNIMIPRKSVSAVIGWKQAN